MIPDKRLKDMSIVSFEEVSFDFIYAYINTCTIYNQKNIFLILKRDKRSGMAQW